MDASIVPHMAQDERLLGLAARYSPIIIVDDKEPFAVVAAGYTVFESEGESPSFLPPRRVEWTEPGYSAVCAVEYALWWDWDIGHLYELEHAWTFVGAEGEVVAVEASWHGMYGPAEVDGRPIAEATHPVLYAQPGKHAMAATPAPFAEIREWAEQEAALEPGKDGVLENALFRARLHKTPDNDLLARRYLTPLAFRPSWHFARRMPITREMLIPWNSLKEWIPARIEWWLNRIGSPDLNSLGSDARGAAT